MQAALSLLSLNGRPTQLANGKSLNVDVGLNPDTQYTIIYCQIFSQAALPTSSPDYTKSSPSIPGSPITEPPSSMPRLGDVVEHIGGWLICRDTANEMHAVLHAFS